MALMCGVEGLIHPCDAVRQREAGNTQKHDAPDDLPIAFIVAAGSAGKSRRVQRIDVLQSVPATQVPGVRRDLYHRRTESGFSGALDAPAPGDTGAAQTRIDRASWTRGPSLTFARSMPRRALGPTQAR